MVVAEAAFLAPRDMLVPRLGAVGAWVYCRLSCACLRGKAGVRTGMWRVVAGFVLGRGFMSGGGGERVGVRRCIRSCVAARWRLAGCMGSGLHDRVGTETPVQVCYWHGERKWQEA